MVIPKGLASIIVIMVLILPEIAAQGGSAADNVSAPYRHQDNTIRVDPIGNFKTYRGGFNITNKHYWSSVVFTGVYGYAIGVLWLLCGIVFGIFWVTINFCCQNDGGRRVNNILPCNYKICDQWQIPLAILFMILAMTASGLVIAGSSKFHSKAMNSVNIIINTVNNASEIIHNATVALEDTRDDLVDTNISAEVAGKLNSTAEKFNAAAENIVKKTRKNRRIVDKAFKAVFIVTIVVVSLNLIAVIALSVSGGMRFWRALYLFVILCWLITVMCWLLFGLYIFLENFSSDTCTAFDNFEENPYNNSLRSIIPCDELRSVKSILSEIGGRITHLVNEVNSDLSNVQGTLLLKHVLICNPFSAPPEYLYQPENCPANTIQIGDIPKVLKAYTCFDNDEKCGREDFISSDAYEVVESYTRSIQNLLNMYPSMEHLLGCQMVKDAFSQILLEHCKPLKKFARMAWIGLVFLAVIIVFFVVLWTIKACHEHSDHLSNGSVQPQFAAGNA